MRQKVFTTGSSGFIYSNFMRLAVTKNKDDYRWASLDNLSAPHSIKNIYVNSSHNFYIADVTDKNILDKLFDKERPDIVIHGAASSHVDDSITDASSFVQNNVVGTQNIIDACLKYNVNRLILASTDEVYGQLGSDDEPWKEEDNVSPRNPYSASKLSSELLVKAAHQTHGLNYNIIRSCNNLGPRQSTKNLVPKIIKCVLSKEKIPIYGQGLQRREWLHVADNCNAILHLLKHGDKNQIYNVSAGYEISNLEMVHEICNIMESGHDLISFIPDPRPGHDFRYAIDNSKLKSTGWEPHFKFKKSLEMAISWYINNQWFLNISA